MKKIYKKHIGYKKGKLHNQYIFIENDEISDLILANENNVIPEEKLQKDNPIIYVYKVIEIVNGEYMSCRLRNRMKYVLNEEVKSSTDMGIFFCNKAEYAINENFNGYDNIAIMKAKVFLDDLLGCSLHTFQFSKCIPIEITRLD